MDRLETAQGLPLGLQLPISAALLRCLQRCTSPEIFLHPLADRFLRLVLQLGQRYTNWHAAVLAVRKDPAAAAAATAPNGSAAALPSPTGTLPSPTGASAGGASTGTSLAWVANLAVEDLSVFYSDLVTVAGHLGSWMVGEFSRLLEGLPDEAKEAAEKVLQELVSGMQAQVGTFGMWRMWHVHGWHMGPLAGYNVCTGMFVLCCIRYLLLRSHAAPHSDCAVVSSCHAGLC